MITSILPQKKKKNLSTSHYKEIIVTREIDLDWAIANCNSIDEAEATEALGYRAKSPGILLKGAGTQVQFIPDKPWASNDGKNKPKYRTPLGDYDAILPNHPEESFYWFDKEKLKQRAYQIDGNPCLVITEGMFKAIAATSHGIPTIALLGVEMGLTPGDPIQGKRLLVPSLEKYARDGFNFIIGFDADVARKREVKLAQ